MQNSSRLLNAVLLLGVVWVVQGCGGGGTSSANTSLAGAAPAAVSPGAVITAPAAPLQVTVTGQASYESVPANQITGALNYAGSVKKPARGITVQAVSAGAVLASTTANDQGNFSLNLPVNTAYFLRMRAELVAAPGAASWAVSIKDNTAKDALWVVDGAPAQSGAANSTVSISAGSGWNGSSYTTGARGAGPFAALDTVYTALKYLLQTDPALRFPALTVFWSPNNSTAQSATDDYSTGEIGGTFFLESTRSGELSRAIYLLGSQNDDTDEYDSPLITHEVGHYVQSSFSADHSLGGSHANLNKLDMTVAFAEGWANAWSSMARGNPIYQDSYGLRQTQGFVFSMLDVPSDSDRGWYREDSIDTGLYALFQAHGFAPIWQALTGPMAKTQQSLSTIFSFADAVRSAGNAAVNASLNQILSAQNIFSGSLADAFGQNETNNGASSGNLPIYAALPFNTTTPVCFINDNKTGKSINKLGLVRYFRITLIAAQAGMRTVTANFANGRDLDFEVFQNRSLQASAGADSQGQTTESTSVRLSAGEVIIRVSDFVTTNAPVAPNCATITVR
jgi:hypothetical protein